MSTPPQLFDRRARAQRRDRAWRAGLFSEAAYLHDEAISTMIDRLSVVTRAFPDAALFGAADGRYRAAFEGRFGIERLRAFETAPAMARACGAEAGDLDPTPLLESSADLIVAGLELHTIDDPVGALIQARRALRPDGLFIGCLFGGDSLWELREALTAAEAEVSGGLRPRVAPMTDIRSAGALLQRAGFALPVADLDRTVVWSPSALHVMRDLRAMGETNALRDRARGGLSRAVLRRAIEVYADRFGRADGKVPATVDILTLTGWAPAESQQKPLRPGSAAARLSDALGVAERPAGEKAGD